MALADIFIMANPPLFVKQFLQIFFSSSARIIKNTSQMNIDQALLQLENLLLDAELNSLPQARIKLAHLEAKLVERIDNLKSQDLESSK
jgi:hypothetical protein